MGVEYGGWIRLAGPIDYILYKSMLVIRRLFRVGEKAYGVATTPLLQYMS
jgi:hypothetical protein